MLLADQSLCFVYLQLFIQINLKVEVELWYDIWYSYTSESL